MLAGLGVPPDSPAGLGSYLPPGSSAPAVPSLEELQGLRLGGLRALAEKAELDPEAVDEAMDSDNAKEALIDLLLGGAPAATAAGGEAPAGSSGAAFADDDVADDSPVDQFALSLAHANQRLSQLRIDSLPIRADAPSSESRRVVEIVGQLLVEAEAGTVARTSSEEYITKMENDCQMTRGRNEELQEQARLPAFPKARRRAPVWHLSEPLRAPGSHITSACVFAQVASMKAEQNRLLTSVELITKSAKKEVHSSYIPQPIGAASPLCLPR